MTVALGVSTHLFGSTLHKIPWEYIDALPRTEYFNGSAFMEKRPSGIAPIRLEVCVKRRATVPLKRVSCTQFS